MAQPSVKQRIWGWAFFDWAQQPYATLGLTFIFSPYFAAVATQYFMSQGADAAAAKVDAQGLWSTAQTFAGLFIAFTAPFLGAFADMTGRKRPWFWVLTSVAVICAASLWGLQPDGTGLMFALAAFWIGFVASESAFNLNNAILPDLGETEDVGRISGSAAAFGYWGGVLSLFIMLLFFAENETGRTLIGLAPAFGLDPETREGTRFVGPFIALWFAMFLIPFFMWTVDTPDTARSKINFGQVFSDLRTTITSVGKQPSTRNFLLASLFYRDALSALYAYGGVYATLVLGWSIIQIGVFGIIAAIAAAVLTWAGGIADQRLGPKPVIRGAIVLLIIVCSFIVGMSRDSLFGIPLTEGSALPDIIFYICGAVIGGMGGALYSASRSLMVRHADPARSGEAFGLFALAGRATAWLAPALIALFTYLTQSNQMAFLPVIGLFIIGLVLLRWVDPQGEQ
jgi:UMF1 family MFS transporter